MGLVNLRSGNLLLFSLSQDLLSSLTSVCSKAGYKSVFSANTIPQVIQDLKLKKIDILISDVELGGTNFLDFLNAIKTGFPKVKVLPLSGEGTQDQLLLELKSLGLPALSISLIHSKEMLTRLDSLMMQKMGIAVSSVAVSED